jgi:hypothetical protein
LVISILKIKMVRTCTNCSTESTKCWRRINESWYCNPCALYFTRNNQHKQLNETPKVSEHEFESFECKQCNKIYSQLCTLRKHCKEEHSGKGCELFSKVTSKTHSSTLDFFCPVCETGCKSHSGIKRHMTKSHPENEDLRLFHEIPQLCFKENFNLKGELLVRLITERMKECEINQVETKKKWKLKEINEIHPLLKLQDKNDFEEIVRKIKTKNMQEVLEFSFRFYKKCLLCLEKKRKIQIEKEIESPTPLDEWLIEIQNSNVFQNVFDSFDEVRLER